MKKRIISMLLIVAAMTTMLSTSAFAAQNIDLKVTVDDTLVEFPDAKPFADENNRTLIPVRFVTEAMGADVSWDQASQTAIIEKDGIKVEITIGQKNIKVTKDGSTKTVTMDTVAVAKDNRTFVPIRFVAEALGAYVDYSDLYKAVEIVMPEEVTAAEIKRLRSYNMIQYLDLSAFNKTSNSWWLDREEYKSFTGNYWFSNSHYFLVTLDQVLAKDAKNFAGGTKAQKGANALDYANFAVQTAEDEIESQYAHDGSFFCLWSDGGMKVSFRTDEALIYQMVCQPQAYMSVRGVMDVEVLDPDYDFYVNRAKEWYGVDLADGQTFFSVDAEVIMGVNRYGYLETIAAYYFDADGNPVKIPHSHHN